MPIASRAAPRGVLQNAAVPAADIQQPRAGPAAHLIQQVFSLPLLCREIRGPIVAVVDVLAVGEIGQPHAGATVSRS